MTDNLIKENSRDNIAFKNYDTVCQHSLSLKNKKKVTTKTFLHIALLRIYTRRHMHIDTHQPKLLHLDSWTENKANPITETLQLMIPVL